jgi:DNA mismatch repair protein MutS2
VLLDELGAGTDPAEGAALAMSIIDHLHLTGALVVATTHYSELKSYAYQTSGVQNASVEFDVNTLKPTYRLNIGLPGKSNAFEISRRLGLTEHLIARAREYLTGEQVKVEDLIKQLEDSRREAEAERDVARQTRVQAEALRADLERRSRELSRERSQILARAKQEARTLLARQKEEMDQLLARLRESVLRAESSSATSLMQDAEAARQQFRALQDETAPEQKAEEKAAAATLAEDRDFRAGDQVLVKHLGQPGQLLDDPGDNGEVQVQLGALRLTCRVQQLEKLAQEKPRVPAASYQMVNLARPNVSLELDLRGQTVDEAILRVDKYLDDAAMAGLPQVHLIHGKGTGALRNAVRDFVKSHAAVSTFRFGGPGEGGTGVTVVELKK